MIETMALIDIQLPLLREMKEKWDHREEGDNYIWSRCPYMFDELINRMEAEYVRISAQQARFREEDAT